MTGISNAFWFVHDLLKIQTFSNIYIYSILDIFAIDIMSMDEQSELESSPIKMKINHILALERK